MTEALIVLGIVLALVVAGTLAVSLSWQMLVIVGAGVMAAGFLLGVPTGLYYHVALYRVLKDREVLHPRWYWSPVRYHEALSDHERWSVLRWFYLGGTGFALIMLGGAIASLGLLMAP